MSRAPLAPAEFPALPALPGLRFAVAASGVKYQGRDDVMLALLDPGSTIAGLFTRSATRSDAVRDCEAKLGGPREAGAAILVNAGNANAFTGHAGQRSVDALCAALAARSFLPEARIFTSSTGVIGEPLEHDKIIAHLDALLAAPPASAEAAASAIMTTDTFAKGAARQITIGGQTVNLIGIAKGSGMIAPDMATMLVYLFTDGAAEQAALQAMLRRANETTFNCITVDGDTSTSDTLLCAATGQSGVDISESPDFEAALRDLMEDLAHQVVRDGEGAQKFVTIRVSGAHDDADARRVAMSIANSPLVKTAIAGEDANWGRVVMAVGKSGARADRDRLTIRFGEMVLAEAGQLAPAYREADGAAYMKRDEIDISVDLGLGQGAAQVWTCDLTHGYIDINADYRS